MLHPHEKTNSSFRLLSLADYSEAIHLLKLAAKAMRIAGLYQWDEKYPNEEVVREAIATNDTYGFFSEDQLAGLVTLDERQDPLYAPVDWTFKDGRIGVIHRLAVSPDFQGLGVGKRIMELIHEIAKDNGFAALRLDAFRSNPKIQKLYTDLGYRACGEIYIYPERPSFICFEKKCN